MICTACDKLSDVYSGLAGMVANTWHFPASIVLKPLVSLPNTRATCCDPAIDFALDAASRTVITSCETDLSLPLTAKTKLQSAMASSKVSVTTAVWSKSAALTASDLASPSGNFLGLTKYKRLRPMVFMARAVEPILPGWLVWQRTTRILLKMSD